MAIAGVRPQVLTSGGQSIYSWQAGSTHPTGLLSWHNKICFTNSFMVKTHILPKFDSRVQHQPHLNLAVHTHKMLSYTLKFQLLFIGTTTSCKVTNYIVKPVVDPAQEEGAKVILRWKLMM